jgi:chromosome segregation ATPase
MESSSAKGKHAPTRLQLEKLRFHNSIVEEFEARIQKLNCTWRDHVSSFERTRESIDDRYDALILQLETIHAALSNKLLLTKQKNGSLIDQIEQQKNRKTKLQNRAETTNLEVSAEIDLELKLQQRSAELHVQLGESQRRLERQLEKKVKLKKAYIRVINQYKKLKEDQEMREYRRHAFEKKAALERQRKEREEAERKAKEAEKDPRNLYRALLAAAGHIDGEDPMEMRPDRVTFYQGPTIPDVAKPEQQILVDPPKYEECVWLENNIRTLLSTGNYTEDGPVIRGLQAQLARIKGVP